MRRLHDAGAQAPRMHDAPDFTARMAALAGSVTKGVPMIYVPDVARALDWYASIGFKEINRERRSGEFGMAHSAGRDHADLHGRQGRRRELCSTRQVNALYEVRKSPDRSRAAEPPPPHRMTGPSGQTSGNVCKGRTSGGRQFCVRDSPPERLRALLLGTTARTNPGSSRF